MHRLATAISVLVLAAPLAASAITVDELRAQINDLLARISALQGQGTGGYTGTAPVSQKVECPRISRVLRYGAVGDDVSRLQRFLALDPAIYPEAQVTGYYGPATERAVQRWQTKFHIVSSGTPDSTGFGVTGPRTAALMALQCPDVEQSGVGGYIRVSPISGAAPLVVSVQATVNTTKSCSGATYQVDFGDNSGVQTIVVPANACAEMQQVFTHTYAYGGTFPVTLRAGTHQTAATVTVSGSSYPGGGGTPVVTGDSFSAQPTSGSVPLSVTFTGIVNAGNSCSSGPYTINFGDGSVKSLATSGCGANSYTVTHLYGTAGNYTARLYRGAPAVDAGSIAIAVTGSSGSSPYSGSFSVTPGISGDPQAITAQFDIESSCAAYDLDWGDASLHVSQAQGTCSVGTTAVQQSFSHTYANPGSYTITLKRGSSLSSVDTASIVISN